MSVCFGQAEWASVTMIRTEEGARRLLLGP